MIVRLQLHIEKAEPGIWPEVIVGDKRGNLVADLEQIEEIHQRLAHLTSDQWVSVYVPKLPKFTNHLVDVIDIRQINMYVQFYWV